MTFVATLPVKEGVYWHKDSDEQEEPDIAHLVDWFGHLRDMHTNTSATQLSGLWSGPLVSPDDAVSRELFKREVEAAWQEGHESGYNSGCGAVWPPTYEMSRAFRMASGKEKV